MKKKNATQGLQGKADDVPPQRHCRGGKTQCRKGRKKSTGKAGSESGKKGDDYTRGGLWL